MRGRVLHNCLAEDVKAVCDRKRIRSVMEYAVCLPSTTAYFDVAAWLAHVVIDACGRAVVILIIRAA